MSDRMPPQEEIGTAQRARALIARARDLAGEGRADEAIVVLRRVCARDAKDAEAHFFLGTLLGQVGRPGEGEPALRTAARLAPRNPNAWRNLGICLTHLGKWADACVASEMGCRLDPRNPARIVDLAAAYCRVGDLDRAEASYCSALEIEPESNTALLGLALLRTAQGRPVEAERLYRALLEREPEYIAALTNLALLHRFEPGDSVIERMIEASDRPTLAPSERIPLVFALGKVLDDIGDYNGAFVRFEYANRLTRCAMTYDPRSIEDFVERTIATFNRNYLKRRRGWGAPGDQPVFVVGMGRSGTSLIEQILASHPDLHGAGELMEIERRAHEIAPSTLPDQPYAVKVLATLDRDAAILTGRAYIECVRRRAPKALRIVDKMPLNFLHLGFIATILPNARIIHCRRDPRDTCLSLFFQHFAGHQPYAYDLSDLGRYYRAYQRLMDHWRGVLPLRLLEIEYESVVNDLDKSARRLIAFCDLPWDDRCLTYFKTKRAVHTASVWQVRQPIYRRSVGRWRNYERHIGRLIESLGLN